MRAEDVDAEGPSRLGVDERLELRMSPLRMTPAMMMSRKKRLCQPCRWMGTRSSARVSNSS